MKYKGKLTDMMLRKKTSHVLANKDDTHMFYDMHVEIQRAQT